MLYEFEGRRPEIGEGSYVAPSAQVIGNVKIGRGCYIGHGAIVRGDYGDIEIGDGTAVEEAVVIHVLSGEKSVVGSHCTLGHGAVVHSSFMGDWAVIGMNAVVSIGARVGRWAIVAEGAVVKQGDSVPDETMAAGIPAKPIRPVLPRDKAVWEERKQIYVELAGRYLAGGMKPVE